MWPTLRAGDQLQHGVEHAQPGAEHRHHHHVRRHALAAGLANRRHDGRLPDRQIAQRLGGQQDADPDGQPPERVRLRRDVAEREEDVLDERMPDEDDGHAQTIHEGASEGLPRAVE